MARTIVQSVRFATPAADLFEIYLDSRKHSAATGGEAKLGRKAGQPFTAWDGWIKGVNLAVVPKRLIVQSWRGRDWDEADADSILILSFSDEGKSGRVDMVHANVPDACADDIEDGWGEHYWEPWRSWLAARKKR
jgi:activator of HSP90 ATPase